MAIRERAQQILRLPSKEARKEGMKLIADALINNDGSIKEVESGLGKNYFRFLVSELKQQLNPLNHNIFPKTIIYLKYFYTFENK